MRDPASPDERRWISGSGCLTNGCLTALVIVAGLILSFPAICSIHIHRFPDRPPVRQNVPHPSG